MSLTSTSMFFNIAFLEFSISRNASVRMLFRRLPRIESGIARIDEGDNSALHSVESQIKRPTAPDDARMYSLSCHFESTMPFSFM